MYSDFRPQLHSHARNSKFQADERSFWYVSAAMWKFGSGIGLFFLFLFCQSAADVAARGSRRRSSKWQTLNGDPPLVIARGGFSGVFPDSSVDAYQLASLTGLKNIHVWCDVQLTKDGTGICFPDITMQNASDIGTLYVNRENTYVVNGVPTQGWFSVDFTIDDLTIVSLKQGVFSRPENFDGSQMQILTVDDIVRQIKPPGLWLNIQHDAFFRKHNLDIRKFILSLRRHAAIDYISSPEVAFLQRIATQFRRVPTKLVFRSLKSDYVEPSTNHSYGSLLSNLTLIKSFASGILVPKSYIWPVDVGQYLQNYTSLVLDAHAAGLEVFASDFANDAFLPYDYSYDPVAEYLSFVDNGRFSVDGVLSDFPVTPSATIDCFSHMGKNETIQVNISVISSEGASGDYPGCTDKAYERAVLDGADILDCPVQMTNDGIPFCLGSINLRDRTNVAHSDLANMATNNPELKINNGIFAYNLTWSQIQSLKPALANPYLNYSLFRNPRARSDGNFIVLSDFLAFASNASSVSGVLIGIENAAYLAEKQGLGVIDAVLDALTKAGYNNQTAKRLLIKSTDSAVLSKFKSTSNYELVYQVPEDVRDISNSTILDIKKFAASVIVSKDSVFPSDSLFITGQTNIVPKLQAFNLTVYVQIFQNEYVSQPWDFFSDPYMEINNHVSAMRINGVITDFPATAARYKRNRCLGYKGEPPAYMSLVQPRGLIDIMPKQRLPPAEAPNPILSENDVAEPPLPPVRLRSQTSKNGSTAPSSSPGNGLPKLAASIILNVVPPVLAIFVVF